MKISGIAIVDDEKRIRATIRNVIKLHYSESVSIYEAEDVNSALETIVQNNPEVVLLDIKMPNGSGFDLLKKLIQPAFKAIFITAYNEFAIQAFKFSALDYLLKPVIPEELVNALHRAEEQLDKEHINTKINVLLHNLSDLAKGTKKIVLNSHDKIHVIEINEIVRCEAERNYTKFILLNKKPILVSGSLKEYEERLENLGFFRSHHSHLINLSFVDRLEKRDGGVLIMKDNSTAPVSFRRYSDLVAALNQLH